MFQTKDGILPLVSVYAMVESDIHQRNIFKDLYDRKQKSTREMYVLVHKSLCIQAGIHVPPGMPMTYPERLFYAKAHDGISETLGNAFDIDNPFVSNGLHKRQVDWDDPVQRYALNVFNTIAAIWNAAIAFAENLPRLKNIFIIYYIFDATAELYSSAIGAAKSYFNSIERHNNMTAQEKELIMAELSNVTATVDEISKQLDDAYKALKEYANFTQSNMQTIESLKAELKTLNSSLTQGYYLKAPLRRPVVQKVIDNESDIVIARLYDYSYTQPHKTRADETSVVHLNFFAEGLLLEANYDKANRYVLNQNHDNLLMEVYFLFPNHEHYPHQSCQKYFADTTINRLNRERSHKTTHFMDFAKWFDWKSAEFFKQKELSAFQRCSCTCGQKHVFNHIENLERCMCLSNSFYGLARFVTEVKGHIEDFPFSQVLQPYANTHNSLVDNYSPHMSRKIVPSDDSKAAMMAGINAALNQQLFSCDTHEFEVECETQFSYHWLASRLESHEFLMSNSTTPLKNDIRYQLYYRSFPKAQNNLPRLPNEQPLDYDIRRMIEELRYPPEWIPLIPRHINSHRDPYSATQTEPTAVTISKKAVTTILRP